MSVIPRELYYFVGEKPPALPCRYETDAGVLIDSISGATLTAKCKVDEEDEFTATCTNADDGTFTIDWATGTSSFAAAGAMRIDVLVAVGDYTWYMPRFSIPIKAR